MADSYDTTTAYAVEYEPVVRPAGYVDLDAMRDVPTMTTGTGTLPDDDYDRLMADMASHEDSNNNNNEEEEEEEEEDDDDDGDIWDDTALIEAWDAAYDEYKKYHAKKNDADDAASTKHTSKRGLKPIPDKYRATPVPPLPATSTTATDNTLADDNYDATHDPSVGAWPHVSCHGYDAFGSDLVWRAIQCMVTSRLATRHAVAHASDPDTLNMVTAWYYAGYYTAIHEAKQQQQQQQQHSEQVEEETPETSRRMHY
ncbi:hypothetical protein SYNPS1DRAFT_29705 [Syncephalis pseudoplumigaleata]|uniref:Survival Motor Neuron Gemin2-binding domain-containing protein n=1 Tax=Syncephalis pseudoplumigaleata TaxID=1712513 RepID=A0A4V1J1C0_9FUNG|nr:hypothetical protein SYNPS1DRAFT_29705 [Syncephalis pseudoplumigaleata]|eukprot:RKP24529.1 hypothetical protein SYNPS1DRAFT_29705 [Syncephalis pseudoplumigaleata]